MRKFVFAVVLTGGDAKICVWCRPDRRGWQAGLAPSHIILHHIRYISDTHHTHTSDTHTYHISHTQTYTRLAARRLISLIQLNSTQLKTQLNSTQLKTHNIFDTHHFSNTVTDHISQTIFHTPFFTHSFVTHHLCHTPFFTTLFFTLTRTILSHIIFPHLLLCFSFLPRPRYNISCSLLEEDVVLLRNFYILESSF